MCWLLDLLVLKTSACLVGTEIRNTHGDIHNKSGKNASSDSTNHGRKFFLAWFRGFEFRFSSAERIVG